MSCGKRDGKVRGPRTSIVVAASRSNLNDALDFIVLFLAISSLVGVIEFGVYALWFLHIAHQSAVQNNFVQLGEIFAGWFSNAIIHLVSDAIIGAFITAILDAMGR